ncbi:hypothetical protein HanRHA438_Chr15g0725521 [Helianthus annuus]|nr:hypothetical protein HanIR_Chr15g0776091 [Helianthus annuus]KAJ0846497.1 hypothetical protein HanRHA438_Chr15g0725521 [Helianthus annuus]
MRCNIVFYKFSLIPGVVVLLTNTYLFICLFLLFFFPPFLSSCLLVYVLPKAYVLVMVFGAVVSLEAASLSPGIEVRLAYILPSPNPVNSFTIGEIILGMVVVVLA